MTWCRESDQVINTNYERNFTVSPTIPVVLIKANTVIEAKVATGADGTTYGRIWIGPPDNSDEPGHDAALIVNSPDTLDSLAEVIGTLANDLRAATS